MDKNEITVLEYLQRQESRLSNIEGLLSAQKNILNIDDVCKLTGLSKSHIYKLTCYSKIPYYKQARHLFFDRADIESWLKMNRYKPADELDSCAATFVTLKKGGAK